MIHSVRERGRMASRLERPPLLRTVHCPNNRRQQRLHQVTQSFASRGPARPSHRTAALRQQETSTAIRQSWLRRAPLVPRLAFAAAAPASALVRERAEIDQFLQRLSIFRLGSSPSIGRVTRLVPSSTPASTASLGSNVVPSSAALYAGSALASSVAMKRVPM